MRNILIFFCFSILGLYAFAQNQKYAVETIAFYNVENLFDTINDPNKNDEASPIMNLKSNLSKVYKKKIQKVRN